MKWTFGQWVASCKLTRICCIAFEANSCTLQVHFASRSASFRDSVIEGHLQQNQEERVPHPFSHWTSCPCLNNPHASRRSLQQVFIQTIDSMKRCVYGMIPRWRPNVDQVLCDEFMTCGYMPTRLPLSCLTMAPRFDAKLNNSIIAVRRPLGEVNREMKLPAIGGEVAQSIFYRRYSSCLRIITQFLFVFLKRC